jgi:hypothetical protein
MNMKNIFLSGIVRGLWFLIMTIAANYLAVRIASLLCLSICFLFCIRNGFRHYQYRTSGMNVQERSIIWSNAIALVTIPNIWNQFELASLPAWLVRKMPVEPVSRVEVGLVFPFRSSYLFTVPIFPKPTMHDRGLQSPPLFLSCPSPSITIESTAL